MLFVSLMTSSLLADGYVWPISKRIAPTSRDVYVYMIFLTECLAGLWFGVER